MPRPDKPWTSITLKLWRLYRQEFLTVLCVGKNETGLSQKKGPDLLRSRGNKSQAAFLSFIVSQKCNLITKFVFQMPKTWPITFLYQHKLINPNSCFFGASVFFSHTCGRQRWITSCVCVVAPDPACEAAGASLLRNSNPENTSGKIAREIHITMRCSERCLLYYG